MHAISLQTLVEMPLPAIYVSHAQRLDMCAAWFRLCKLSGSVRHLPTWTSSGPICAVPTIKQKQPKFLQCTVHCEAQQQGIVLQHKLRHHAPECTSVFALLRLAELSQKMKLSAGRLSRHEYDTAGDRVQQRRQSRTPSSH